MSVSSEGLEVFSLSFTPSKKKPAPFSIHHHGNTQSAQNLVNALTPEVETLKKMTQALMERTHNNTENLDGDGLKQRIQVLEGEIDEICSTYLEFCDKFLDQNKPKKHVRKERSSRNMSNDKASNRKSTPDAISKFSLLKPRDNRNQPELRASGTFTEYSLNSPIGSESSEFSTTSISVSSQSKKLERLLDISDPTGPRRRGLSVAKKETDSESPFSLKYREYGVTSLPPVINPETIKEGFTLQLECHLFNQKSFTLDLLGSLYADQFSHSKHSVWVGSYPKTDDYLVVVIESDPSTDNYHRAMVYERKGISDFQLLCVKKSSKTIEKALEQHFYTANFVQLKSTPELTQDLTTMEEKHKLAVKKIEIGVIYSKSNQTNPLEMFLNVPSPTFKQFIKMMDRDKWRGFPVVWHNATEMNEEQHRGVIGNLQCLLFFKEKDGVQFDASEVSQLGPIPQFFIVVEPCLSGFRVGFFYRTKLQPFGPELPENYIFDETELLDFLLTKVHNAYMAAMRCGSLSRLHEEPFACTLKEIAEKYAPKTFLKLAKH
eukprot:TRINITY_DN18151_c0_g1_i1.p1 TRINITY_DN18151_c0_g1~~TRINITY_DN18151_c0_g1_i1.p1  ORF type:complete len:547 (+),score=123.32 TRINITY_DN18151_c0_g1_i1:134-1774(+)